MESQQQVKDAIPVHVIETAKAKPAEHRWLKRVVMFLAVLMAIFDVMLFLGYQVPKQHMVSRTLSTHQVPAAIWRAITDASTQSQWRKDVRKVEVLDAHSALPIWRETDSQGRQMTYLTTEFMPPHRLTREVADADGPFTGKWVFSISQVSDGSLVTITETARVGNPFYRFMGHYIIGEQTYIDDYLKALAGKFGEKSTIQ